MRILISALLVFLRALLMPKTALALENTALRQQNMVLQRVTKRPSLQRGDRIFWALLRTIWSDWARPLSIVKPATVIGWPNTGLKALWRSKSRPGRPRIPRKHINFIKRMSVDHPEWGEDKIVEELAAKFGINHSGSTVRRYMVARSSSRFCAPASSNGTIAGGRT